MVISGDGQTAGTLDFTNYRLDEAVFDEMFHPDRLVRKHYAPMKDLLDQMPSEKANEIQDSVAASFRNEGIAFTVYGGDQPEERMIPVDCIPRLISGKEWGFLESGLAQRLKALNLFLNDVYGDQKAISDGVIPAEVVLDCPHYRPRLRGLSPPLSVWVAVGGIDIVRTNDGFRVLEDNLRVPSGVSYMVANRKAIKSSYRRLFRDCRVRHIEDYGQFLLKTLMELAPSERGAPTVVVLTPGIYNSAFYEHMFLAREIGAPLVEGQDLVVRDGFVFMKTISGLARVDVIYRRVDDDFLDPEMFRPDSVLGVPGIMEAYFKGNVALANAPGTGVADDKSVYAYVPDLIRYFLGDDPILENVDTRLCRNSEDLAYTLDNLDKLVVKRVDESGGYGLLVGPHASVQERNEFAEAVKENPALYISQPVLQLSRAPCLIDGQLEPRHVDLRPFVLTAKETRIVPGAFCRVALRRGSLVVNSSQGGGGKDFWVLED